MPLHSHHFSLSLDHSNPSSIISIASFQIFKYISIFTAQEIYSLLRDKIILFISILLLDFAILLCKNKGSMYVCMYYAKSGQCNRITLVLSTLFVHDVQKRLPTCSLLTARLNVIDFIRIDASFSSASCRFYYFYNCYH